MAEINVASVVDEVVFSWLTKESAAVSPAYESTLITALTALRPTAAFALLTGSSETTILVTGVTGQRTSVAYNRSIKARQNQRQTLN